MSPSISPISGIYQIRCLTNGRIYIGQTINFEQRWHDHRRKLRINKHYNPHLQKAWNKYGEDAFIFTILETVEPELLTIREQFWLDVLKPFDDRGFNVAFAADAPMTGKTHTPEARAKIGKATSERIGGMTGKVPTEETRAKLRAINLGKKQSPETLAKKSATLKGRPSPFRGKSKDSPSPETCAKLSASLKGRRFSEETRKKMSIAARKRSRHPEIILRLAERNRKTYAITSPDGIEYLVCGLRQFCLEHGLKSSPMSAVARGRYSHHKGWKCRYA